MEGGGGWGLLSIRGACELILGSLIIVNPTSLDLKVRSLPARIPWTPSGDPDLKSILTGPLRIYVPYIASPTWL